MSNVTYNALMQQDRSEKSVIDSSQKSCVTSPISPYDITEYKQVSNEVLTPTLFEFGINEHFQNKQVLGGKTYYTYQWKNKRGTVSDLLDWVSSGKAIMVGTLPNTRTRRLKNNVISAQAIALDIDEGLSLEDCLKIPFVQNYAAAIYTSASHQKQKGDVAPCDRYRVIFILPEPVTDIALYEAAVQVVMERVGYADKACKDASRMFYGYDKTEVILCRPEAVLPANFLGEVGDRLQEEKAERTRLFEERKRRREEYGETDNLDELIQQALDTIDPDCPYDEWLAVGMALHSHSESNFHLWDDWSQGGSKYPNSRQLERQWSKFNAGGGVNIGSLFHIAKDYGFKFPERESNYSHQWDKKDEGDRLLSPTEVGLKKASEFIQWISGQAAGLSKRCHKGFAAAAVAPVELPKVIRWQNGDPVPSPQDYGDRPIPKIIYARGSNPFELLAGLRSAGWGSALDSGITGDGKTYRAGMYKFENCTGWYLSETHNNPSVKNIEDNYINLWARHNGLWRDEFGNLTRRQGAGKSEIQSNCQNADLFGLLAAKNHDIEGTDNPICKACPALGICGETDKYAGSGFKAQRRSTLAAQQIRADIQQLPTPLDWDYSNNYAIIEEATTQARKALKVYSGTHADLLANLDKVQAQSPDTYTAITVLNTALRPVFDGSIKGGRYGLEHEQILELLPTPPANIDELIGAVLVAVFPQLEFEQADRVNGVGGEFKQSQQYVNKLFRDEAKSVNESILENVPNNILLPLLQLWRGDRLHVSFAHGLLTLTEPDTRKQEIIKAMSFRLFLDATGNKKAIAAGFGLAENSIIEIQQELPKLDNLTVYQTNMAGIKTRKRSKSAENRIAAYKQAWRENDPNVEFLGFKGEDEIAGYWHNHHRGSNKFKGRLSLVSFGLPHPHIGAVQAEYYAFNGTFDGLDGYYQQLLEMEIIQWVGRPRAQHFPDQKFTLDMVATFGEDFDLSFLTERYNIKVVKREAVEFCGGAGTTQEQIKHGIFDIAKGLAAAGEKLTQQAIAPMIGISQQALSKHIERIWGSWFELKKLLQLFLRDTNRDGCKNPESSPPIEPILAAATLIDLFSQGGWESLRAFLEDLPPPEARYWLGCLLRTAAIT